jgi:acyl carrier protein
VYNELRSSVRRFISDNFLFREDVDAFSDDDSFLEAGIIDSTGVLELISFLEAQFSIEVADEEMVPENFDSVTRIVAYLQRKLGTRDADDCLPLGALSALPSYAG